MANGSSFIELEAPKPLAHLSDWNRCIGALHDWGQCVMGPLEMSGPIRRMYQREFG
jgi:hypothetical protein